MAILSLMTCWGRLSSWGGIGAMFLLGILVLFVALHAPTAYGAVGDPPTGSPAGSVYVLPLEQGRSDAAPKSGSEGGDRGSLYRSENNFGSSSRIPGFPGSGPGGGGPVGGGGASAAAGGAGAIGAAGLAGAAVGAAAAVGSDGAQASDAGNTSATATVVLLGAIALVAGAVGALSRRFSRP